MRCNNEDWAVFWCSLLSPVLLGEIPERRRERYFQQLSQEERLLPNGRRKRLSARTLRRQWRRLKDEGVPGLYRRRRSDRGKPRKKHSDLLDRAVALKKEQPFRSDKAINRILKREFGRQLPRSTLYRHLRQQGATRRKLGVSKEIVRCRWTRDQPGAVGWRLRARPAGDAPGPVREDASFGLDRLPQPFHRRGAVLHPREPGHPAGFAAAGLGKSRRQPRTVRGQRQNLPRQSPAVGLHPAQHSTLAPAATRSSGWRADRTLLSDLSDATGSGGPRRNDSHAR